jgi:hypothetical protein
MKRTPKYVGLDVQQATTVAAVLEENGRMIGRSVVPTDATAIPAFFRGMRGPVHVALEEGTQAQWLHDLLTPVVARPRDGACTTPSGGANGSGGCPKRRLDSGPRPCTPSSMCCSTCGRRRRRRCCAKRSAMVDPAHIPVPGPRRIK